MKIAVVVEAFFIAIALVGTFIFGMYIGREFVAIFPMVLMMIFVPASFVTLSVIMGFYNDKGDEEDEEYDYSDPYPY